MSPGRRAWLARLCAAGAAAAGTAAATPGPARASATRPSAAPDGAADPVRRGRPLVFPRDHGAHPQSRIEWWYLTGWVHPDGDADPQRLDMSRLLGFQVTFFRSRTGLAQGLAGRLAPRQLLFAHAAVTDLPTGRHLHAERIARWSGADDASLSAHASLSDAAIRIGPWQLQRSQGPGAEEQWSTRIHAEPFSLDLQAQPTQPLLLQGDRGFSRKGPQEQQASHYLSLPQLAVSGRLALTGAKGAASGAAATLRGRAWLDHEWSDELLHPQAVGWDWVGLNLFDGRAITAFQLRRADGSVLWAGGSLREGTGAASARILGEQEVRFIPSQRWRSAASGADYPVLWDIELPSTRLRVRALLNAQEMDRRASTGTVYWEGLSEVLDVQGQRVGLGYLEMTGYAGRLRL